MFFVNEFMRDETKFEQLINRIKLSDLAVNRRTNFSRQSKSDDEERSPHRLLADTL